MRVNMSKGFTLELSETDATHLEEILDELLSALHRLDKEHERRQEHIERLKTETHVLIDQIRAELNVEKALRNVVTTCAAIASSKAKR